MDKQQPDCAREPAEASQPAITLAARIDELEKALQSIADMYCHEATAGELASAMYEAHCIARFALTSDGK
jgi:hypothetical protein